MQGSRSEIALERADPARGTNKGLIACGIGSLRGVRRGIRCRDRFHSRAALDLRAAKIRNSKEVSSHSKACEHSQVKAMYV
jgi:hypothetical protein